MLHRMYIFDWWGMGEGRYRCLVTGLLSDATGGQGCMGDGSVGETDLEAYLQLSQSRDSWR